MGKSTPTHEPVLQCMDMIGGNHQDSYLVRSPALDVWVDSRPHGAEAGGDVHLMSVCGSGRVTRLVMADVAGHGEASQETARLLRRLVREHINLLDQSRLVRRVNREFVQHTELGRFATVLFMSYFAPTGHLIVCNASHPRPLHWSARLGDWRPLDHLTPDTGPSIRTEKETYGLRPVANLPLGLIEPTEYHQFDVHLEVGDLIVAYSDAFTDAENPGGRHLGEDGLLEMVRGLTPADPEPLGKDLLAALDRFRGGGAPQDDQTLLVARRTAAPPPRTGFRQLARMVGRMLRQKREGDS